MPQLVRLARPEPRSLALTRIARPVVAARPIARAHVTVARADVVAAPAPLGNEFQPDPYGDYGRFLTAEGGVLLVYKDLDERLRHGLWRSFAWIYLQRL